MAKKANKKFDLVFIIAGIMLLLGTLSPFVFFVGMGWFSFQMIIDLAFLTPIMAYAIYYILLGIRKSKVNKAIRISAFFQIVASLFLICGPPKGLYDCLTSPYPDGLCMLGGAFIVLYGSAIGAVGLAVFLGGLIYQLVKKK